MLRCSKITHLIQRQTLLNRTFCSNTTLPNFEGFSSFISKGELHKADRVLDELEKNNVHVPVPLYNTLIQAYLKQNNFPRSFEIFEYLIEIKKREPNIKTISMLFNESIQKKKYNLTIQLIKKLQKHSIPVELLCDKFNIHQRTRLDNKIAIKLPSNFPQLLSKQEEQKKNELTGISDKVREYRGLIESIRANPASIESINPNKLLLLQWFKVLSMEFQHNLFVNGNDEFIDKENKIMIVSSLRNISTDKLALICLFELLGQVITDENGAKFTQIVNTIGNKILLEIQQDEFNNQAGPTDLKYFQQERWARKKLMVIGGYLLSILVTSLPVDLPTQLLLNDSYVRYIALPQKQSSPLGLVEGADGQDEKGKKSKWNKSLAFQHFYQNYSGRSFGMVKLNPHLLYKITPSYITNEFFKNFKSLPTLIKPKKWSSVFEGGYYYQPTPVIRLETNSQIEILKHKNLSKIFDSLDILGSVRWQINEKILKTIKYAIKNEINLQNFTINPIPLEINKLDGKRIEKSYLSFYCDFIYKLQTAEYLFSQDFFYLPHNMDFRGRCYPIPSFNHQNSDIIRSLFLFHQPKPLGNSGLFWIKVHLANLFGVNKVCLLFFLFISFFLISPQCSFAERIKFIDDNIDNILKSAESPFEGKENDNFWMKADKPWQFLAGAVELNEILKSGDVKNYRSNLPIQIDGSCNGLQHYAALGKDIDGGKSVNLLPDLVPQDIYSDVLHRVKLLIETHCSDPSNQHYSLACELKNKLSRKIVKPTVMTFVYGVTFNGAKKQLKSQLEALEEDINEDIEPAEDLTTLNDVSSVKDSPNPVLATQRVKSQKIQRKNKQKMIKADLLEPVSDYLTKLIFQTIESMFTNAREIMIWFMECAKIISKTNNPVSWETPLGLAIEQPYRRPGKDEVETFLQSITFIEDSSELPIFVQKQKVAFPPNYIHSLDSTHMLLTAKKASDSSITFASVHDSYWSHPCCIDHLNQHLRDSFVELHNRPLLEELLLQFKNKYPDLNFPPVPNRGHLNIDLVKSSKYFFH